MARIGVAVIGAGFMGGVHAEALRRAGCEVVGVLGVSDAESTKFAEAIGAPKAYRSLKELLDDKAVESVHIGTPNKLHFEMAKAAIEARQARAVREAPGHDLEGDGRARGPRPQAPEAGRRRQLQHPLLPALDRGPRAGARRAARQGPPRDGQLRAGLAPPRHRLQLAGPGRRGRRAAGGGRHRHPLAGPRPLDHRPRGRGRLRRSPHRPPGAPPAEGRGGDVQRQARARSPTSSRSTSRPRTTAPSSCASRAGRGARSWCRR